VFENRPVRKSSHDIQTSQYEISAGMIKIVHPDKHNFLHFEWLGTAGGQVQSDQTDGIYPKNQESPTVNNRLTNGIKD
jgi:hypothetical protein